MDAHLVHFRGGSISYLCANFAVFQASCNVGNTASRVAALGRLSMASMVAGSQQLAFECRVPPILDCIISPAYKYALIRAAAVQLVEGLSLLRLPAGQ